MLEIRLLGEVTLLVDGRRVDPGPARQRCVLAALASDAGQVVSTERLTQRVWGEHPPARARPTLTNYLSRLRQVLKKTNAASIVRRSGGYALDVDRTTIDLHLFGDLCDKSRIADDREAAKLLRQALDLWRGEALTGVAGAWADTERERLHQDRLHVECDLADVLLRLGHGEDLVSELAARATGHPLDERVAGQYMLSLHEGGRAADALQHYRQVRARLVSELGAEPGPELRDVHRRILTADPRPAGSRRTAGGGRTPKPQQLPAPPRQFTGRGRELAALTAALDTARRDTAVAVASLAGAGGIGKTWLALHWAHQNLDRFPDGQLFVDLRGFSPDGQPMPTGPAIRGFIDAFGVDPAQIPVEPHALAALWRSLVAGKRLLILLDNAADTEQVLPLLPGSPLCTVLITGRKHLTGLVTGHGAHHIAVDVIADSEARELLTARLGADRVAVEPGAVDELLACCGGFPLALSIVAGRAHTHPGLPLARLAAELRDAGLRALDDDDLAANLPTVLSWSYGALAEEPARVFALLGLAPGPDVGVDAAAALTGLAADRANAALRALEQMSLLTQDRRGRFHLHDLIRRYAAECATRCLPAGEQVIALRRLVDFALHTAYTAERLLYPQRSPIELPLPASDPHSRPLDGYTDALDWFDTEHQCLLATQRAASAHGWHEATWQLAWCLTTFHSRRGHLHDDLAAWQLAGAAADHVGDPAARTQANRNLGRVYAWLGRHGEALDHLNQAIALAERLDDRDGQAHAHRNLAQAWGATGDHLRALRHATYALQLLQAIGNPAGEADAHNQVGWYSTLLGRYPEARTHCEAALALHLGLHDREGEAVTLHSLGYLAHRTGRHLPAISAYQRALRLFRELGNRYQEANTLYDIGFPYETLGHRWEAYGVWRRALTLYEEQHRAADVAGVSRKLDGLTSQTTVIASSDGRSDAKPPAWAAPPLAE